MDGKNIPKVIDRVSISEMVSSYSVKLDFGKAEEVNKTFCNTCNSFKSNQILRMTNWRI
jgi:hypothetical protein